MTFFVNSPWPLSEVFLSQNIYGCIGSKFWHTRFLLWHVGFLVVTCGFSSCLVAWPGMELSSSLETWTTRGVWNPLMFKYLWSLILTDERRTLGIKCGLDTINICVHAQYAWLSCDPMDCSLLGCSVHGISEKGILEWVAILLLQGIFLTQGSKPRLMSPALAGGFFTTSATWEALVWILATKTILAEKVPVKNSDLKIPSHRVWITVKLTLNSTFFTRLTFEVHCWTLLSHAHYLLVLVWIAVWGGGCT